MAVRWDKQDKQPLFDENSDDETEMTIRKRDSPRSASHVPLVEEDEMTREGFISPPSQPKTSFSVAGQRSPAPSSSTTSSSRTIDFDERIELRTFPWVLWIVCALIAAAPWLLLLIFPKSHGLYAFNSLFGILALCLAALCDWVFIVLDPVSGMFLLTKNSLFRLVRQKKIDERFALTDIRRVQVIWLGEREMRHAVRTSQNPPCCHSHKSSIQASTILVLTISGNSMFQVHNRSLLRTNVPQQEEMSFSDITAAEGGHLNITIREVQDLLGCESMAVNELHQWASTISQALHLDYETHEAPEES